MRRILLKLSGEALGEQGFSAEQAQIFVKEIGKALSAAPVELALLIGGGNIWRGRDSKDFGFPAAASDMIGMGATVLNAMVLKEMLMREGKQAEIFSPFPFASVVMPHSIEAENKALLSGKIIIFAGGTGCPYFTTDTAAVLRALEIRADAVFKGTKVAGVYDSDPQTNASARMYENLSYTDALSQELKVMDTTAFALARENKLPIFVFNAFKPDGITLALQGRGEGTWVGRDREKV